MTVLNFAQRCSEVWSIWKSSAKVFLVGGSIVWYHLCAPPVVASEAMPNTCDIGGDSAIQRQLTRVRDKPSFGIGIIDRRLQQLDSGQARVSPGDWRTDFTDYSAIFAPVSQKTLTRLEHCRLYNYRGVVDTNGKQLNQAEKDFRKALTFSNRYSNTWSNLGVIMHKLHKTKEAFECINTAISVNPRCTSAWKAKSDLEKACNQITDAKDSAAEFSRVNLQNKKDGLDPELMDLATSVQAELEKLPPTAASCAALGLLHWNHLRFDQAEMYYKKGMSCKPANFLPAYNLGRLQSWRGKNREALQLYDQAIAVDGSVSLPYFQKANSLKILKDYDGAIANFSQFLKLYKFSNNMRAKGYVLRAECYGERKQFERGLQDLKMVDGLNCSDELRANCSLRRAKFLKNLGRKKEALAEYDKAISIAPNAPVLLKERGELAASLGEYEEGMMDLSKSMQQVETSKRTEIAPPSRQQLTETIAEQTKLIRLAPKSESLYYDRGLLQLMLGDYAAAVSDLKTVLSLNKETSQTADAAVCFAVIGLNMSKKGTEVKPLVMSYVRGRKGPFSPALEYIGGRTVLQKAIDRLRSNDEKTRGYAILGLHEFSLGHYADSQKLLNWVSLNGNVSADEYPLAITYQKKCQAKLHAKPGNKPKSL